MTNRNLACCLAALVSAFACLLASGCGPRLPPFTKVEGTVLLDGRPLPGAVVEFVPELTGFGADYNSTAITDDKGHYELVSVYKKTPGALVARHHVLVREQPIPEEYRTRSEENERKLKELLSGLTNRPIPRVYASFTKTPLIVEVTKQQSTHDLTLLRQPDTQ